ncbi:monocarboxylate transporter 12 isoform X2 [Parasteatoda tepidariorum]|nr:uncharacterized protein LOC107441209 isoform X2 [Parasteatoda tepidariorum]
MKRRGVDSLESWVVALAASMVLLLACWPMRLGSQLFVEMLDRYNTNRKATSFPFAMAYCARSLSGPFAGFLGEKFGLQAVTLCGCVLLTIGVGGCFFADGIIAIDVCLGIIYGIAFGWSTALVPEIINRHFDKHRGKGHGIVFGLSGLANFATPPLLDMILVHYGVSGTFLIMAGIILHSVPAAMLLTKPRPEIEVIRKRKNSISSSDLHHISVSLSNQATNGENYSKEVLNGGEICFKNIHYSKVTESNFYLNNIIGHKNIENKETLNSEEPNTVVKSNNLFMKLEENIKSDGFSQKNDMKTFKCSVSNILPENAPKDQNHEKKAKHSDLGNQRLSSNKDPESKPFCSSFNIFWNPVYLLVTFIQSSHAFLMYISWTIMVDFARDKEVEEHLEVHFVMGLLLFDTIGRTFLGTIIDKKYLSVSNFSASCFAVMGLSCLLLIFVSGFSTAIFAICLFGFACGGNTTGLPGIVTEFIPKEQRAMAMASRFLMYAPMSFAMSPLIGYFRGKLGSYDGLLYVMIAVSITCSFLLVFFPRLVNCIRGTVK